MKARLALTILLSLVHLLPSSILAAEPTVDPAQVTRVPPTPPAQAVSAFQVKPGFKVELVASEPLIVDPIALCFDENGRLYVVEMRGYSERRDEQLGRIRVLDDVDGDGRFDHSTVFADDLPWPTAVCCWDGGIFVGATPSIYYLKDTDGDDVADEQRVIFTGFGSQKKKLNVQQLLNSFTWALDNRIHAASGGNGGLVAAVGVPTPVQVELRRRDFSFDPLTLDLQAESGGGQHGLSFDNFGRKFVCSNSRHIQTVIYPDRYSRSNRFWSLPSPLVDVAVDGGAAPVYRLSPDEPWRVIRTRWRVQGVVPGPIEGGGRPSGYFTAATGITIYRGHAFPEPMVGDAFVADCGSNLIHRKQVRPDGIGVKAERPPDEQQIEFLASPDNWFRPVQLANGPDGALYVCDMYREVIEHPWSLPLSLKKHLDLNSGNNRGRIYRIVPNGFKQPKPPRLKTAPTAQLVVLLQHRNGWHRDTASRLLYERQDVAAVAPLEQLLAPPPSVPDGSVQDPLTRIHALHALAGMQALRERHLHAPLRSTNSALRMHALQLAEPFLTQPSENLLSALRLQAFLSLAPKPEAEAPPTALARRGVAPKPRLKPDRECEADLQLALTAGQLSGPVKLEILANLIARTQSEHNRRPGVRLPHNAVGKWITTAVVNSLGDNALEMLQALGNGSLPATPRLIASDQRLIGNHYPSPFLHPYADGGLRSSIARLIGIRNRPEEIIGVLALADDATGASPGPGGFAPDWRAAAETMTALDEGLQQSGSTVAKYSGSADLRHLFRRATEHVLSSPSAILKERLLAIKVLGCAPYTDVQSNLFTLVSSPSEPAEIRLRAMTVLARSEEQPHFGKQLLAIWPDLTPSLRAAASELLIKRPALTRILLSALEKGTVDPGELTVAQQAFLRAHRDPGLRQLALKFLGRPPNRARQAVVESFLPALQLPGIATKGRTIYRARCSSCHRFGNEGHPLGPDLASVKSAGKENLLISILDPNREVNGLYQNYLVETRDGKMFEGIIASESAAGVVVRQANGLDTSVQLPNIALIRRQGRALMPDGLEMGLDSQDMADLLAFIVQGP